MTRSVFAADAVDGAHLEAINENDEQMVEGDENGQSGQDDEGEPDPDGDEDEPDDDGSVDLQEVSEVLTVTARRLAGLTLGRKFSNKKPGTNTSSNAAAIAKRKKTSHCSASGELGHWKDDDACPMKGKASSHSKMHDSRAPAKNSSYRMPAGQKVQQAFPVVHHEHGRVEIHDDAEFRNVFVRNMVNTPRFHVDEVQAFSTMDFIGKMVLDSARQRTCCGRDWFEAHSNFLAETFGLKCKEVPTSDAFQFGKGEPTTASFRAYIPVGIGNKPFVLASAVLTTNIPLLGSNKLLERLRGVIDMGNSSVFFAALDVTVPLQRLGGHFVVDLTQFPKECQPSKLKCWEEFSKTTDWRNPDPELVVSDELATAIEPPALRLQEAEPVSTTTFVSDAIRTTSMAPAMGDRCGQPADLRKELRDLHDRSCAPGVPTKGVASSLNSTLSGGEGGPKDLRPRQDKAVWEHTREVRTMPSVRSEVQMEPKHRAMGMHGLIALITIAIAMLREHSSTTSGIPGEEYLNQFVPPGVSRQIQASASSKSLYYDFLDLFQRTATGPDEPNAEHGHGRPDSHQHSGRTSADAGGHQKQLRPVPGGEQRGHHTCPGQQSSSSRLAPDDRGAIGGGSQRGDHGLRRRGALKRLKGDLNRAIQVYEAELSIYNNLPTVTDRPPPTMDLLELFAGSSKFTLYSKKYQLNALAPMDLQPGQDFRDDDVQREIYKILQRFKPWLLIMGIDCRLWSIFNENLNYGNNKELLEHLRAMELPLVQLACSVAILQAKAGRFFLLENPERSRLWSLPIIQEILKMPGVWSVVLDTGAWGAEIDGQMIIKSMRSVGNLPELDQVIEKRLDQQQRQWCQPIQDQMTKKSQEYPDALVHAILRHLRRVVQRLQPSRFNLYHAFAVAQPVQDLSPWTAIFDNIAQTFERGSKQPYTVEPTSALGQDMANLVRMDAVRIQVAHTPTTRRLPTSILLDISHRACVLQYTDGSRALELEHLPDLQFPKQRFVKPVQFAIFMYGTMREVQQPAEYSNDPLIPLRDLPTDITFPGLTQQHQVDQDTRRLVARLHLNLGHPSSQELSRMVAYYGGAPPAVNMCIQHLKCATCERLKPPQHPRPATTAKMTVGQFGDELQGDFVYIRTINGENVAVLGLLDRATGYHQAVTCPTKDSSAIFDKLMVVWLKPFGLPYRALLDPDPSFRGSFQQQLESLGVIVDYCPAESHWMIGAVERRNAILRMVMERLIDQWAAESIEDVEFLLAPALHALNSSTFTRGRTAFQAVFGRIPRLPGGLFTDETSITSSPTTLQEPNNLLAKMELARSEAQRHILELNVSQQLRRAILRKTNITKYPDLRPGQPCAFWRWQRKGQKKRGSWVISRFLSWDPSSPHKLAWVRNGNSSILVSIEQLRVATGFETWQPDEQDIKPLKMPELHSMSTW